MEEFEWNNDKAMLNFKKHGLSFEEAMTTFDDYFALYMEDPTHSKSELRFIIIGYTINNRLAVVSYIERNNKIRIISARLATKKERIAYEEKR